MIGLSWLGMLSHQPPLLSQFSAPTTSSRFSIWMLKPSQDHHSSLDPLYPRPGGEEAEIHPTPHQGIGE
jgi:hypothetical protein